MSRCEELEIWLASDDPVDRARARRHALVCPSCRSLFDAQQRLDRRLESWEPEMAPPPGLEERVRIAVRRRLAAEPVPASRGQAWRYVAAALLLGLLGTWIGLRPSTAPRAARDLLVTEALAAAQRAERRHARAIASLERTAEPELARAEDPALSATEARRLLAYRDRLASIDSTIAEIEEYLRENPAHPGARTVLLAAYRDKTDVLREVLALGDPT